MSVVPVTATTQRKRRSAWLRSPLRRFGQDEKAASAIEFGIIALPFFAILFAIIESGLYFFAAQVFDTGFREAARRIRTGEAQSWSQGQMQTTMGNLINKSTGLFTPANIFIDLRIADFGSAQPEPLTGSSPKTFNPGAINYTTGICGSQVVLMRAYYEWPTFANLLGSPLERLSSGNTLISSTAAFKTEPFGGC